LLIHVFFSGHWFPVQIKHRISSSGLETNVSSNGRRVSRGYRGIQLNVTNSAHNKFQNTIV